jgi:hypothetical protein
VLFALMKSGEPSRVRRLGDRAAVRQVRRLPVPTPERQAIAIDEVEQLRNGIRAIARIQQRIRQGVTVVCVSRTSS